MAIPATPLATIPSGKIAATGATVAAKGSLAKIGSLFGFSSPWGVVAWGAIIGGNWLLSKWLRRTPKIDVTRRESTPRDENVNRRYIMGKQRRVSGKLCYASIVPPTAAAQAIEGSYKSNHLRLIYILSEGAIGDLQGVYLDDSKYIPFDNGGSGNVFTPKYGYTLPANDVTEKALPQSHVIRCLQFFNADGASQPSIQTTVPDGRKYHDTTSVEENPTTPEQNGWINDALDSSDMFTDWYAGGAHPNDINPPQNQQTPFYLEPKLWTENHKLDGVSYVVVELFQPFHQADDPNDDYWKQIPKIEFIVGGLKFQVPTDTDRTLSTKQMSENPIDQLYWYDTEVLKIPATKINIDSFLTARAICEETVTFQQSDFDNSLPSDFVGWLGTYKSFKKYMANHIIEEGEEEDAVHTRLLAACAGYRFEHDGEIHYQAGADTNSVMDLTDDELEDITEVRPWPAVSERYNQITMEIPQNRAYSFKEDSYVFKNTPARDRDGELRNLDINMECVDHPLQAGYLLAVLTRQQEQSFTFSGVIPPLENMDQLKKLKPGVTVRVKAEEIGFVTPQECIVQSVQVRADFRVICIFKKKIAGVYANTLITPQLRPRGIQFGEVIKPDPPQGLTTDEIVKINKDGSVSIRLDATWTRSESPITEVQARIKTPQGDWLPFITSPNNTRATLENVIAGETYEIRARHWSIDNVSSNWTAIIENTIDGDLVAPSAVSDFAVTSLPEGIHASWTNPTDDDFAGVKVYIGTVQDFEANASTLAAVVASNYFESGNYMSGTTYYVKVRPFDTSGNEGSFTSEISVVPTVQAAEGVRIYSGSGQPSNSLGNNDDLYIQLNGNLWEKENGVWNNTGIDLTAQGAILRPFNIAATESNPRPEPNITAPIGSIAFNTATGQYWERTDATTWTYRGDTTGTPGENGRGWVPWAGSIVSTSGVDGDYTVDPSTGNWYLRQNGAWVLQGDLSGEDGTRWFNYQGAGAPSSTTFGSQTANIGDYALSTTSHRYYELTAVNTWTLRGDLAAEVEGSKIVFFAAALGVNPSDHITQSQANIGDEALNTTTAEMWEKTADPNTWVLRGDLGSRVTTITTNDPPSVNGVRIGDLAFADVDSRNRKLYAWEIDDGDTTPSWVFKGYFRGHNLSVDNSVPTDSITGDIHWDTNGDITRKKGDGTNENVRTTNQEPVEGGGEEIDADTNPAGCRVYSASSSTNLTSGFGSNGDAAYVGGRWYRKSNGSWSLQSSRLYTTSSARIYRRSSLPNMIFNTQGWRALHPANSRPAIVCILFPSTEAWNYNYDTNTWTKLFKMCSGAAALPSTPTNFRRTSLTYPSNTLASAAYSWNAVSGADRYRIQLSHPRHNPVSNGQTFFVTGTSTTITNLLRGVTYTVYISTDDGGVYSPRATDTFTTAVSPAFSPPNRPVSVTATPSTSVQGALTVNFVAGAASSTRPITKSVVTVYKDGSLLSPSKSNDVTYASGQSNYQTTFSGLAPGSNYTVRVYHNGSGGNSNTRTSSSFTMPTIGGTTPPPTETLNAPTNVRLRIAFNHDDTEDVYATWGSVTGATSYSYSFSPSNLFVSGEDLTGSVTTRSVTAQLLSSADGKTVTFNVRGVSSNAQSAPTEAQLVVNIDNLASDSNGSGARAVLGLRVLVSENNLISFSFNASSNTVNYTGYQYRIQRKRGSGSFVNISPTSSDWQTRTTSQTSASVGLSNIIFSGHQTDDVYLIRVRRTYSDGNGPESSVSFRLQ